MSLRKDPVYSGDTSEGLCRHRFGIEKAGGGKSVAFSYGSGQKRGTGLI